MNAPCRTKLAVSETFLGGKRLLARCLYIALGAITAEGVILTPPQTVTAIQHQFSPSHDPEFPGIVTDTLIFDAKPFTADLSLDSSISYALRAPQGFRFNLGRFNPRFTTELPFGDQSSEKLPAGIHLTLENSSAGTPGFGQGTFIVPPNRLVTYEAFVGSHNDSVDFTGIAPFFSGPNRFDEIILTVTYQPNTLDRGPRTFAFAGGSIGVTAFSNSDLGPMLTLVTIPEPTPSLLLLAAFYALAIHLQKRSEPTKSLAETEEKLA
jgi:hypothetical protein